MRAAVETADSMGASIYAVTEMSHPGGREFTAPNAEALAMVGVECGVKGFIAPATRPDRIAAIRRIVGNREILSPGVGAQGGSAAAAFAAGTDYVIAGRAIYEAEDPAEAARGIMSGVR